MTKYWLMKSEPDVYSIDDMKRDKATFWNGVRNYAARNFMKEMKKGDLAFFYHSNAEPSGVAGIVKIAKEAAADPTQFDKAAGDDMGYDPKSTKDDPRWFGVTVAFVEKFDATVPLADIKKTPALKNMKLLKLSRLSVSPVTAAEWKTIVALAEG